MIQAKARLESEVSEEWVKKMRVTGWQEEYVVSYGRKLHFPGCWWEDQLK